MIFSLCQPLYLVQLSVLNTFVDTFHFYPLPHHFAINSSLFAYHTFRWCLSVGKDPKFDDNPILILRTILLGFCIDFPVRLQAQSSLCNVHGVSLPFTETMPIASSR